MSDNSERRSGRSPIRLKSGETLADVHLHFVSGVLVPAQVIEAPDTMTGAADIPHFLSFKSIKPFIDKHLGDLQSVVVKYRTERGALAHGIRAEIIPKICDVWIDADESRKLGVRQKMIAQRARLMMRALAHVGIVSLVDEATGYQKVRARDELQKIR